MNHVTKEMYIKRAFRNCRIPVVIWTNILVEDSTFLYAVLYIGDIESPQLLKACGTDLPDPGGPKLFWVHGCEI